MAVEPQSKFVFLTRVDRLIFKETDHNNFVRRGLSLFGGDWGKGGGGVGAIEDITRLMNVGFKI